jgi:glycosyltransferase involved in cell wall biosynthesis
MTQTHSVIERSNITLSAILITKNEAHQIKDCLESINFCDEIILVDNCSQDSTLQIAMAYGCYVIQTNDWPGYGAQKQRALDAAKGRWILSIDADERVTPELREEILKSIETESVQGYFIKRRSRFLGRWMRFGGWHPDYVLRLAQRDKCKFEQAKVHEKLIIEGIPKKLHSHFLHYSYSGIEDLLSKQKKYALLSAEKIRLRNGVKCSVVLSKLRSLWTFFRLYFLQLGFLDGREGFISATFKSEEVFWKYVAAEFEARKHLK